jgi:hypothetical protein
LEPDFDRSVLFATTCGLIAGQLLRNRRRNQVVDPLGVAVGAGASAHPARDVATWLTREIGAAARNEMHLMAAFGTGLALAYLAGASHGLAKGEPRDAPYTS